MLHFQLLKKLLRVGAIIAGTQLLTACATPTPTTPQTLAYAPGLGEFMSQISARHIKLWYAGVAHNWSLADYELEEIHEGLDDLAKYHPTHDKIKGSLPDLMAAYMKAPLEQTEVAIKTKNAAAFQAAYDTITAGCNSCHQANNFGFNAIQRPASDNNPFPNQLFTITH